MRDTAVTLAGPGLLGPLLGRSSDAIYVIDPESSLIIDANQAACDALGMTLQELLQQSVMTLNEDVTGLQQWRDISAAIRQSGNYTFVGRHRRKDGSDFPVEVVTDYLCHDGHEYLVSIARDLSDYHRNHEHLLDNELIRTLLLHESSDGLWDWCLNDNSLYLSPQWFRIMGYGPHEIETPSLATWRDAVHPDDLERVMESISQHLAGKCTRYTAKYRLRNRNGQYLWVRDRGMVAARDAEGQPLRMIGLILDVTETEEYAAELLERSRRDELTGLYNRRAGYELFTAQLDRCRAEGRCMSVAMLDIDHFKQVNDRYGHLAGDRAICHVAATISEALDESDLLFRWGGEEFLLLLPGLTREQACERLVDLLEQVGGRDFAIAPAQAIHITFSAGVSLFPGDGQDIRELVQVADAAMYAAKQAGRNRIQGGWSSIQGA